MRTMFTVLVVASVLGGQAHARSVTVHPGESIQAALDAAAPGSTVIVLPGVYHEPGTAQALTITRDDIRLLAHARPGRPVVLERTGAQTDGIWVSPTDTVGTTEDERPPCGTSGARIRGFRTAGFTVRGFPRFGIYFACVDRFRVSDTTSTGNGEYAIFPVASRHGRIQRSLGASTRTDACIYVGEDDDVLVDHNTATDCQIGFEIENSRHVALRDNDSHDNTAGIIVDVINNRLTTECSDNRVERNVFATNNRPNSASPEDDTADLQPGIGVIIAGADRTTVAHNTIRGNQLAGLTLVDFCLERADICAMPGLTIDPNPDDNHVVANTFSDNQTDVIYLPSNGKGNCFARNRPAGVGGSALPTCP